MCTFPLVGYRTPEGGRLKFLSDLYVSKLRMYKSIPSTWEAVEVPCGRCLQCSIKRKKEWAVRCVLEAKEHNENCFITLTYAPEHLPKNGTLVKRDFQLFMKRLRKRFGSGIRFFMCGEYGSLHQRPHYHAILFGFDFPDKEVLKVSKKHENILYRSPSLEELWPFGISSVGSVTYDSAAYVARYIEKKQFGKDSHIYKDAGIIPEFTLMSRKPGIAANFLKSNYLDIYSRDFIQITDKIRSKPPRYFDNLFDLIDSEAMYAVKEVRKTALEEAKAVIEQNEGVFDYCIRQNKFLHAVSRLKKRSYEDDTV